METALLYNPKESGEHAHCPTLYQANSGKIFAVWYAYIGPDDYKNGSLVIATKIPGEKWGHPRKLDISVSSSIGNAVLYEVEGTLHLLFAVIKGSYWTDAVVCSSYSKDEGRTWSQPEVLFEQKGLMIRHTPLQVSDGSYLLPVYDEVSHISMIYRLASGVWQECHRFDAPLIQACLTKGRDKELFAFFRPTDEPKVVWRAYSNDEGKNWSAPIKTILPCPLSGVASFFVRGRIGLVYNHTEEHQRYPLSIAISGDRGISWSTPHDVDSVALEVSYPSFIVDSDDVVHGVYSFNRRMIKYVSFDVSELVDGA